MNEECAEAPKTHSVLLSSPSSIHSAAALMPHTLLFLCPRRRFSIHFNSPNSTDNVLFPMCFPLNVSQCPTMVPSVFEVTPPAVRAKPSAFIQQSQRHLPALGPVGRPYVGQGDRNLVGKKNAWCRSCTRNAEQRRIPALLNETFNETFPQLASKAEKTPSSPVW